jgi:hypothetical protein
MSWSHRGVDLPMESPGYTRVPRHKAGDPEVTFCVDDVGR